MFTNKWRAIALVKCSVLAFSCSAFASFKGEIAEISPVPMQPTPLVESPHPSALIDNREITFNQRETKRQEPSLQNYENPTALKIRKFMNIPDDARSNNSHPIGIVEMSFDRELHSPDTTLDRLSIDTLVPYSSSAGDEDALNKATAVINGCIENLMEDVGDMRSSTVNGIFERGSLINFLLAVNFEEDENDVARFNFSFIGSFKGMSYEVSRGDIAQNNIQQELHETYRGLVSEIKKFLQIKRRNDFENSMKHSSNVLACIHHISSKIGYQFYTQGKWQEIASNDSIKVINLSTINNGLTQDRLEQFNMLKKLYAPFVDTGKILVQGLGNAHSEFHQIPLNMALLDLAEYAKDNGFHVLLVGSSSLEERVMGEMCFITPNTPGLARIMKYYITAPGYQIPMKQSFISGNSFAAPHVAGALNLLLAEELGTPEEILEAIVLTGRKKEQNDQFLPTLEEKLAFMKNAQDIPQDMFAASLDIVTLLTVSEDVDVQYKAVLDILLEEFRDIISQEVSDNFERLPEVLKKHVLHTVDLNELNKCWNHFDYLKARNYLLNTDQRVSAFLSEEELLTPEQAQNSEMLEDSPFNIKERKVPDPLLAHNLQG